jgi:transposase
MRYELTNLEWTAIKPFLPNKPRGVPRVNDRRVLNGVFWVLRSGAPWRDLPQAFGPYTTCYNRFVRWRRAGVWGRIMNALASAHDAAVQMIDTSIVRVHQHAACVSRNRSQSMGQSRGGLTSKIHAVVDTNGLPVRLALTAGEAHDNRLAGKLLSRLKSGAMLLADRGYEANTNEPGKHHDPRRRQRSTSHGERIARIASLRGWSSRRRRSSVARG